MKNYASVSTLYVSNEFGHDDNFGMHYQTDCYAQGPFKTLDRALKFVSGMRMAGYMQPVTIKIMDDEYPLTAPLSIGQFQTYAFNGNAKVFDVTIESFDNNKKSLISGGKRITGFKSDNLNGIDCFSVEIPEVKDGSWSFNDLYVDGIPAKHSRYPEQGFLLPERVEVEAEIGVLRTHSKWFIAKEGDIPNSITDIKGATVRFSHYWLSEIMTVEDYDAETRKCTFDCLTRFSVSSRPNHTQSMYYYLENVACGFTKQGQWYLDRQNGKLYYCPLDGQTLDNIVVYAPVVDRLIDINGYLDGEKARGINFRNLAFAYTKSDHQSYFEVFDDNDVLIDKYKVGVDTQAAMQLRGAINFSNATGCYIDDCEMYCVGTYGVKVHGDADHITIENTVIHDCLGGGVSIGYYGPVTEKNCAHDVTVRNCHLYNLGIRHYSAIGVLMLKVRDCTVENNDIHDLEYSGISLGWSWGFYETCLVNNRIRFNRVYNIGKGNLSDMGAIYVLGKQKGTIVSNNIVHDVKGRDYGAIGIYCDEGCFGALIEKNIVWNAKTPCHIHFGAYNSIRNNIFAFAQDALITMGRAIPFTEFLIEKNILLLTGDIPAYGGYSAEERVLNLGSMFSDYNIIYNIDGKEPLYCVSKLSKNKTDFKEGMEVSGYDKHSIFEDPLFKDARNFDFTLDENSPALKLGFKPIDVSKIGYKNNL